jgi:hypothetical protein
VLWCGSKNRYQKNTCLKVIGLRIQNMIAIISAMFNWVNLSMTINEHKILHIDKTYIYMSFKTYEERNITQFLGCILWDQVSHGHNSLSMGNTQTMYCKLS